MFGGRKRTLRKRTCRRGGGFEMPVGNTWMTPFGGRRKTGRRKTGRRKTGGGPMLWHPMLWMPEAQ